MTKEFKELPELGEYIQYVGDGSGFFNKGMSYEIIQLDTLEVIVIDDSKDMHHLTLKYLNDNFVAKTKKQADVHDLLANLGRRLHEVEQYLADEEAEQYPDDEEFPEEAPEPVMRDTVNSPNHYTSGPVEVIDYIDQVADGYEGKQAVYAGNIIKYVSRAPYKNQAEDIRKAIWYAQRLAGAMEAEASE